MRGFMIASLLLLIPHVAVAEKVPPAELSPESLRPAHPISPVYEQMLANRVHQERMELGVGNQSPFHVTGWDRNAKAIASEVALSLLHHQAPIGWSLSFLHEADANPFQGAIVVDAHHETEAHQLVGDAAHFLKRQGNDGFLVILTDDKRKDELTASINKEGLDVLDAFSERDLEFVKDSEGRQIVDLDWDRSIEPVYERLVREGMNPVLAWPAARGAIHQFRQTRNRIILVVGRT